MEAKFRIVAAEDDLASGERQSTDIEQAIGGAARPAPAIDVDSRATSQPREHFIPIAKRELIARVTADAALCGREERQMANLCQLLSAVLHHEYHARLEGLKETYAPFDPDGGATTTIDRTPSRQRELQCDALFDRVVELFERANYRRLRRADIDAALDSMSEIGVRLDVELAAFERLEVFVRGDGAERRQKRKLRTWYRLRQIDVPTYKRLVVAFHPREHKRNGEQARPEHVYLKMFKNIPKMDLDMLLPGTRVKMSLFEQGSILLPAVSGVALTVYKIVQGALVIAFAGFYGLLAFLGVLGGTLGYGVRSFVGYLRTKDKHQLYLTRSLYFQNLDNNVGVLFRALDEAEEQDFREALLAWFILWRDGDAAGWTMDELDAAVESYLCQATGKHVDFEVDDAMVKLSLFDLVDTVTPDRWRACTLDQAVARLDRRWDDAYRMREETSNEASDQHFRQSAQ
jgi:hypothetical protein